MEYIRRIEGRGGPVPLHGHHIKWQSSDRVALWHHQVMRTIA